MMQINSKGWQALLDAARLPAGTGTGRLDVGALLQRTLGAAGLTDSEGPLRANKAPAPASPWVLPAGAQFLAERFTSPAGSRPYKVYVPAGRPSGGGKMPLIVMLHGCTQSPDDFAAGTRMNQAAEASGCLVAYPGQTEASNHSKCWNWFNASEQGRAGEPALIAGITLEVMARYDADPARVYVAGLSAGGAAAAIMAETYPELYAAVGVHSGLACGAARDLPSAFAAMRNGAAGAKGSGGVPAIVFHGDRDSTVHSRNGDAVIEQLTPAGSPLRMRTEAGQAAGGHPYHRTVHSDAAGRPLLEQWVIHGAGHAWSGGSVAGTYTDPKGPDASREMLRFFLTHSNAGAA